MELNNEKINPQKRKKKYNELKKKYFSRIGIKLDYRQSDLIKRSEPIDIPIPKNEFEDDIECDFIIDYDTDFLYNRKRKHIRIYKLYET